MAMKLVKKTADYSIFQRGDDRYAVKDGNHNAVNGDDKVRILAEEGLIKAAAPAEAPAEEPAEEPAAEEEEAAAEEASEDGAEEGEA